MQIEKNHTEVVEDFVPVFTGALRSLNPDKNPYIAKAKEIAKNNNIPDIAVKNAIISAKGSSCTFKFSWRVEVEAPESEKTLIVGYLGNIPTIENPREMPAVFIKRGDNYYKSYLYNYEELIHDYKMDTNTVKITNEDDFIDSLNIDFYSIYSKALATVLDKFGYPIDNKLLADFLNEKDVKSYIIQEDPESLDDTAPRETLCYMYQEFLRDNKIECDVY